MHEKNNNEANSKNDMNNWISKSRKFLHAYSNDISAVANIATSVGIFIAIAAFTFQYLSFKDQLAASEEQRIAIAKQLEIANKQIESAQSLLKLQKKLVDGFEKQNKKKVQDETNKWIDFFTRGEGKSIQNSILGITEDLKRKKGTKKPSMDKPPKEIEDINKIMEYLDTHYHRMQDCIDLGACDVQSIIRNLCWKTKSFSADLEIFLESYFEQPEDRFAGFLRNNDIGVFLCNCTYEDSGGTWFWNEHCPCYRRYTTDTSGEKCK